MPFEEFKAKRGKFIPQITLNKSGGFGMSSGMHHKYGLDFVEGVKIYFDKEANKIGIKLVLMEEEGTFKLKKRPNQKGALFSARSFLLAYSIDPKKYNGRYDPVEVQDPEYGSMFVIDLKSKENEKAP